MMIVMVSSLIFSCSDGEDGAIGPQGEQGAPGADGQDGADGAPGTANVMYSSWIPVDYLVDGAQTTNLMGLEVFNASELNPETDVVLVYGQRTTASPNEGIYQLPYLFSSQNEYYTYGLFDTTGGTGLQIRVNTTDGGTNLFTFFQNYRYVIIPGGIAKTSVDYATMSYEEIIALFKIPE